MTTTSSRVRSEASLPNHIKKLVRALAPAGSTRRHLVKIAVARPLSFPNSLAKYIVASIRLTGVSQGLTCLVYPGATLQVVRRRGASAEIAGKLIVRPFLRSEAATRIVLDRASQLKIRGDLEIGSGVAIVASPNATITIGGRLESGAGFSADSLIFARERIEIGPDSIFAWGCNVVDSDWHELEGSPTTVPVSIGASCWVGHDVSILKGASIPEGCVVGAKSVVGRNQFRAHTLIAGSPARIRRDGVRWRR